MTMEPLVHGERTDLRGSRVKQDLWENQELRASLEKRWGIKINMYNQTGLFLLHF